MEVEEKPAHSRSSAPIKNSVKGARFGAGQSLEN
jgi:hypothetical protein